MHWALEDVWSLRDVAELVLQHLNVEDLCSLRASSKILRTAVDVWGVKCLVVRDDVGGAHSDYEVLPGRFPAVRSLVLRSHISSQMLLALTAFASKGRLSRVEYDECELSEEDVGDLPAMPVDSLIIRDGVFASQEVLDVLFRVHPAKSVRLESTQLKVAGNELMIIGNEQQQFIARLGASRKQVMIPPSPVACTTSLAFAYNIHLTPQKPLWKSPAALETMQSTLQQLDLSGNALGLENMQLLFYQGKFSRLKRLRLRDCCLTESHMEIISQSTSFVSLEHLDLSQNRLGTPIASYYLASSTLLTSQLTYLSLADQEETTEDWLYGLAITTSRWEKLAALNASYSASISAGSMLGICESMPRLKRLLLRNSYVTKDALTLFGRSNLFTSIEEIDLSVSGRDGPCVSRGVEARRVEDCFCARRAENLKVLKLRASATRQSRKYDRKALKALKSMHGEGVKYVIVD